VGQCSSRTTMTRYSASITLPLTSTGSGALPPTWIKIAEQAHIALHIMLDPIAVFARSELRKRPLPRIQAIALLLHLDLIGARLVGVREQLLEQQISALFSRARVHVGKAFVLSHPRID